MDDTLFRYDNQPLRTVKRFIWYADVPFSETPHATRFTEMGPGVTTSSDLRVASVDRAAEVLLVFCSSDDQDLGVSEIARSLNLSKAVVYRILNTLTAKNLVKANPTSRRYSLGPAVMRLAAKYKQQLPVRSLAMPALRTLADRTMETVTLSVRNGSTRTYIEQIESPHHVKMSASIGEAIPLYAGATSKAFLAHMPEDELADYLGSIELVALTDRTITDRHALRAEISEIRRRGYATSAGEREAEGASVASAILNQDGYVEGVISVGGPAERFRPHMVETGELLAHVSKELSAQLGHVPTPEGSST